MGADTGNTYRRPEATALLVPIKAFDQAKARLAPALGPTERAALAREMADRVLHAAGSLHTAVVCDDQGVADWASAHGAEVIWRPGRGLNPAVEDGVHHLGRAGYGRAVVSHADLPLITGYAELLDSGGVVLVPDRHEDGTNVLVVPTDSGFEFAYGPGSFGRHRVEAERLGLGPTVVRPPRMQWDIDTADDLDLPASPISAPLEALSGRRA